METPMCDRQGYSLCYPFMCFAKMPRFKSELKVPDMTPEVVLRVIHVNPALLASTFSSVIEEVEKRREKKSDQ